MTTAERRTKFLETEPVLLNYIYKYLEEGKYRDIETDCLNDKRLSDPDLKDYVITLLCDELIKLTNNNESEEEGEGENPYLLTGEELERAVRARIAGRK